MRTLIVAATEREVAALRPGLRDNVDVLVAGIGMVATAVRCSHELARERYDLAVNVGLCGSFDPALVPGTVVHVVRDRIAELGAEDGPAFRTFEEIGLPAESVFCNPAPPAIAALNDLPRVSAITVNTVHGNAQSITAVVERFGPQIETMEGAAFMSACLHHRIAFAQIRAVSNVVEPRNRAAWRIDDAIRNLTQAAGRVLEAR